MKLRIWQKISILMLIPISFEIAATAFLVQVLNNTQKTAERFENSRRVLSAYHTSQNNFNAAGIDIATLGTYRKDGSPPDFAEDRKRLLIAKHDVVQTADVDPNVKEAFAAVPAVFDHALELLDKAQRLYYDKSIPLLKRGSVMKNDVFALIMESDPLLKRVVDAELSVETLEASELQRDRLIVIFSAVGAFVLSLLISLLVGMVFYRSFGARLLLIEGNAEKVAIGQTLPPPLTGGDEIDELDQTLHNAAQYVESLHEKEFAVLNKSTDVLCSIDSRFKIVSVGESVDVAWHYTVDDLLGRSVLTLFSESEAQKVRGILTETARSRAETDFETELRCGDGNTRDFAWKVSWNPDEGNHYCVIRDISERKNVERAKQRLLAIASHDLRTPLMSVSANLSSLSCGRFGDIDDSLKDALVEAEENLDKLMDLIQSLLDLERMESTKTNLELNCVSALDVALEAIRLVDSDAQAARVKVVPPSRDEAILADERRLVQILTNLLQNGIRQSTAGQAVTVTITSTANLVQISVNDEGPGLAPEELDLVFEKYFQSRNKETQKNKGNSLSLALAKVLTEAQNGKIGVHSERGQGSHFYVQFSRFNSGEGGNS